MSHSGDDARRLRILHVLRAPVGGLFRHVVDISREQLARGHEVGLICDSTTGGERSDASLAELAQQMSLGVSRVAMHRNPHPGDVIALGHVAARMREARPDVVHGHGSKGGLYARMTALLPGCPPAARAYTPHGGSFNYQPGSRAHRIYMSAERLMSRATDIFLFESEFIAYCFARNVGFSRALQRVVLNGICAEETVPVAPYPDAADFVYIGELRSAKGIDTMLLALAEVAARRGACPRAILVGSGPDKQALIDLATRLGLHENVSFPGPMAAREAFARGRTLVVPSRAESLPYVVLEAAGARIPMIATDVGGIPEIFGPCRAFLIPCDNVAALRDAMLEALTGDDAVRRERARQLGEFVAARFTLSNMADAAISGYRDALRLRGDVVTALPVSKAS